MHDFHYFCVFLVYKIKAYAKIEHWERNCNCNWRGGKKLSVEEFVSYPIKRHFVYTEQVLCNHVTYVTFDTNLCTRRKATTSKLSNCLWSFYSLIMLGLLFCECPDFPLIMFIISINSSCGSLVNLALRFSKIMSRTIFSILCIYIYSIALTPVTCIISLMVFQIWCHSLTKNVPLVTNHSDFIVQ